MIIPKCKYGQIIINFCFFNPPAINRAAKVLEETLAIQEINRAINSWNYSQ